MKEIILNETEKQVLMRLQSMSHLCLYGAGSTAKRLLEFCLYYRIEIEMLIVSERNNNPMDICGIPVHVRDEIPPDIAKTLNVVPALKGKTIQWVEFFQNHPFNLVCFLPFRFMDSLENLDFFHRFELSGKKGYESSDYWVDMDFPYAEPRQFSVVSKETGKTEARLCVDLDLGNIWQIYGLLKNGELNKMFSNFNHVPYEGKRGISDDNITRTDIYLITTQNDNLNPYSEDALHYHPLQVGAVFADSRKDCMQDDSGDNISNKNKDYSECTGLYWIWKNTRGQKYVGLEHYRRRMGLDDTSVSYIEKNDIDFVVALPQFTSKIAKDFFMTYLSNFDWKIFRDVTISEYPDIKKTFEMYENGHFYLPCNVGLWKREWFDRYCEFAFKIANRLDTLYHDQRIVREDRYMGYIFENLHTLFSMFHKDDLRIAFADIEFVFI